MENNFQAPFQAQGTGDTGSAVQHKISDHHYKTVQQRNIKYLQTVQISEHEKEFLKRGYKPIQRLCCTIHLKSENRTSH